MKHRTTCRSDGACLWHNGLSINISLLTELFMVFFQKTKLLQKIMFAFFVCWIENHVGNEISFLQGNSRKIDCFFMRFCFIMIKFYLIIEVLLGLEKNICFWK